MVSRILPPLTLPSGAYTASLCLLLVTCVVSTPMAGVHVSKILVHPIKSCRGISVQHSRYTPEGLEYDRRWCIVEKDFTVITAREFPKMVLITSEINEDPTSPHSGNLLVSFPKESGCESFAVPLCPNQATFDSWKRIEKVTMFDVPFDAYICEALPSPPSRSPSAILSAYFGREVHLVYKGPQVRRCEPTATHPQLEANAVFQDCFPLMVLSEESTTRIEEELRRHVGTQGIDERWKHESVVIERFRPNIVFSGAGPFAEDTWEYVRIGAREQPLINLVSKCTRCLLPNVSPDTGERDKAVPFKVLMKFRTGFDAANKMKACVGVNGVPEGCGEVRVGDEVAGQNV